MRFSLTFLLLSGLALVVYSNDPAQGLSDSVCFQGSVLNGEDFLRDLPEGLVFRLIGMRGDPSGWTISVAPSDTSEENYCAVVTPPYRGINALQIYSWHFAGTDEEGVTNAPGEKRHFRFVTGNDDYELARDCLEGMLWPEDRQDFQHSVEIHESIPVRRGVLSIKDVELSNAETDSAVIEKLDFLVTLYISGIE
ncbi:MAG: hypothetical protein GF388_07210 [Candidatus Aegiribacteria sp.]|nr:hypothetical protein [Candidatus Aegiribacteria sp.]MBD3294922.1 hypothetical protein [Candidatus Fermentibacteria bacterium]